MNLRRRRLLEAAATVSVTAVAGCLDEDTPGPGGEGTPGEERTPIEYGDELARVEAPRYDISEPACDGGGQREPLWLCANMPAEPSLRFEQVETPGTIFAEEGLRLEHESDGRQFYAALLADEDDLDRVDDDVGDDVRELIEGTDFEDELLLVAQTGWGSGTVTPHLKRVEETTEGLRAFGCYRRPCGGTADHTMRTVVARVARPVRLDAVVVSLTFDAEHVVNFAVDEGVVTVDGL